MPWVALGVAAVGAIGSFMSNSSANERAEALQNENLRNWFNIHVPDPAQQKLALQAFVQEGKLTPQLEAAIKADPSAFTKIATDQNYKQAQNQALSQLQDIGNNGGLRLQDRAALQDAQQNSIDHERGERMAIEQNMAGRGMGGSGFAAASQLQAQQSGADRNARNSLSVAAQAQDRALQSIMGAGQMATQYQNQDFNQQAQKASAADKINLFNTQNMQDVQQRNVNSQNATQAANLAQQQATSDKNTQLYNYQQQYNKQLLQQQFDNKTKAAAGMSGQYGALAGIAQQQGQNMGNAFSNAGGGASNAIIASEKKSALEDYFDKQRQNSGRSNSDYDDED